MRRTAALLDYRLGDVSAVGRRTAPATALSVGAAANVALVAALAAVSLVLRTRALDASFWVDEAISVGIASHPLREIPSVLRQDGSPPLYYVLLHFWMRLTGTSEAATHALSVVFAVAAVPAAYWAGASVFTRRTGWIAASLAAVIPFLTLYGQETRMYSLVAFLSVLATAAFLHAFAFGRRRYIPVFAVLLALLLYTHNWGLFFAAGAAAALVFSVRGSPSRRNQVRDGLLGFGGAALLFTPWLPVLVYQALHTGAPWSKTPSLAGLLAAPLALASADSAATALLLAGGSGLVAVAPGPRTRERAAATMALVLAVAAVLSA